MSLTLFVSQNDLLEKIRVSHVLMQVFPGASEEQSQGLMPSKHENMLIFSPHITTLPA